MRNTEDLIAQLAQLHVDNEMKIERMDKNLVLLEKKTDQQYEALMYWLTKPLWKKWFGVK